MNSILTHGAVGDGNTDNTPHIQQAIDACAEAGGGTVLIPAGCFLSGPLTLRNHVHLYLEPGAILKAIPDIAHWPVYEPDYPLRGTERTMYKPFLYARNATGIGITGAGTIDGSGEPWWTAFKEKTLPYARPHLINPSGCTDVVVEGVTLTNSPRWTLTPVCCENVRIHGISIRNPHNAPNTDGINPDSCQFVRISDCYLNVGDDCITLKSGEEDVDRPPERASCENITITNCTMVRGHGAVVCGSEMSGNVRNVTISNCVFRGTDRGLRFKSRRGRGGIIENVRMTNIVMEDVRTPLCGNLFYHCEAYGEARVTDTHAYPLDDTTPRMERLHFSHITARNAWHAAGVFHGLPEMSIRDLVMEDIDIQMAPDAKEGWTIMASTIPKLARRAFVFRHVDGLRMRDVRVDGHEGPFLDQEKCENLKVDEGA